MGWKRMCESKEKGGMGFRDISFFNKAMLAKISWRLVKSPQSLMENVLKDKYYQDGNFLKAKQRSNPSLTWRSILWRRSLFVEGYR